jgi:hypothetical protein
MLGATSTNKLARLFALLLLLGAITWSEFVCGMVCIGGILQQEFSIFGTDELEIFGIVLVLGGSFIVLFLLAAMSRIAPVVENRSTKLRACMFVQQLLWVMAMVAMAIMAKKSEVLAFGIVILGGYWIVMGTMMLAESAELSPRILRDLPTTFFLRALFTWFNPGPGTGYLFATTSGLCGMAVLALATFQVETVFSSEPFIVFFVMSAYLLFYLGLTRLVLLVLPRQVERTFPLALVAMALLLMAGIFVPLVVDVLVTGDVDSYEMVHVTNWLWTIIEIFDRRWGFGMAAVGVFWMISAGVFLVNLFVLFRELGFRRIATPLRVLQDRSATNKG